MLSVSQFCAPCDVTRYKCLPHRVPLYVPNERGYGKKNVEINSGTAVFSVFSFSQFNYTWEHPHLFLEWLWVFKDSWKFALGKDRKLYIQIDQVANSIEIFFLKLSYTAAVLLSLVCEHCPLPLCAVHAANLIKLAFRTYVPLIHANTLSIAMHVCVTILLGLNQPTNFAANLLQCRGESRNPITFKIELFVTIVNS